MLSRSAAFGLLASTATAAFNAASGNNVVVYWGQGDAQIPLSEVCNDPAVDIVNIAFVNGFPKSVGEYPKVNFANACGSEVYSYPDGTKSEMLSNCPTIGAGIDVCHGNGKKVLLSIGGGWPIDYYLENQVIAEDFADFLWGAFGPATDAWKTANKPRLFGDASVDGFDLDLEAEMTNPPFPEYRYANYNYLVDRLRSHYAEASGEYYISSAPQCIVPDVRLSPIIEASHFDFVFTQFYNTPACSARTGFNGLGAASTEFTFDKWAEWLVQHSKNPDVKLYIGLPADTSAAKTDVESYLTPDEANSLITEFHQRDIFGGVMLWEATISSRNKVCEKHYATYIRESLDGLFVSPTCPKPLPTPIPSTVPVTPGTVSTTGQCGPTNDGFTCLGSAFGNCCSAYGFCGSTSIYCDDGCQEGFGKCGSAAIIASKPDSTASAGFVIPSVAVSAPFPVANATADVGPTGTGTGVPMGTGVVPSASAPFPAGNATSDAMPSGTGAPMGTGVIPSASAPFPIANATAGTGPTGTGTGAPMGTGVIPSASAPFPIANATAGTGPTGTGTGAPMGTGVIPSASAPFPAGNATSGVSPSGTGAGLPIGTGVAVPTEAAPFPTMNSTDVIPSGTATGIIGTAVTPIGTGSAPVGTGIVPSGSVVVIPSGVSTGSAFPTMSHGPFFNSSVPAASSTDANVTPVPTSVQDASVTSLSVGAGAGGAGAKASSSAQSAANGAQSSAAVTPCTTGADGKLTPVPTPTGPVKSDAPAPTPCTTGADGKLTPLPATSTAPVKVQSSAPSVTTTVYTTTYVDICPTGFTTVTATLTKTVCPKCATATPTPNGPPAVPKVPEGWTTTVAVCGNCGPKTVTVTLTKPIETAAATPVVPVPNSPVAPANSKPATPANSKPATPANSKPAMPSTYTSGDNKQQGGNQGGNQQGSKQSGKQQDDSTTRVTQTVTQIVTPVPVKPTSAPAPYGAGNGTAVYAPSGTASKTGAASVSVYAASKTPVVKTPIEYQGAASHLSVGVSAALMVVAGLLVL